MSGSRVYEFHQQEIGDLKRAAVYTLAVCTNLKRLLEGIRDNQPHWAARAIGEFLDPNNKCQSYLDKVDHLIDPEGVPVKVPRRVKLHRGSDGIHYEKKFPLTCEMREEPMAHRAAWMMHDTFSKYLWDVWCRGNPTRICTDDVGAATDQLATLRWQEIRDELQAFVDYDCDGLRRAVEAESRAAMDRCRQSIVGDATAGLNTDEDEPGYLDITLGDREASRIVNGETLTTNFGRKGKPWELFRALFHAGDVGLSRTALEKRLWPNQAVSYNSLDQHKSRANELLDHIRIEISPDNRGVWRLAELNT